MRTGAWSGLGVAVVLACSMACSSSAPAPEPTAGSPEDWEEVPDGKADNYFSDVAAEYEVRGSVLVKFASAQEAQDPAVRKDKIERRTTAVALFLTAYMTRKLEGFFTNMTYGGFGAMARTQTLEPGSITEVSPEVLKVAFSINVAGPKDLMKAMPKAPDSAQGVFQFDLSMPEGYEADPNNVPRGQIRNFDAATYSGAQEKIRCDLVLEKMPKDAWPQVVEMLSDNLFDVTLFYGHDYNAERSDLEGAREAFSELTYWGFTAPVERFEDLRSDSGPFKGSVRAAGRTVPAEVRIFHSDMFKTDRKLGHDTALSELIARDVFFYNGHAGPYYGFYLSDDKPNDVGYQELSKIAMTDKQQIFIAQGCQTYSQYADVLYANPAKSEKNLDVITTVNFSYGVGTLGILSNLLTADSAGNHNPPTFAKIISDLNAEYWNKEKEVFYGVTGIDDNPRVHPYAALDKLGTPCKASSDCGDPTANVCVKRTGASAKTCGAVALSGATCPAGTKVRALATGTTIKQYACLK